MIKFFLHGGYIRNDSEENRTFFRETLRASPIKNPHILIVTFARSEEIWEDLFITISARFSAQKDGKECTYTLATIKNIVEQLRVADIICIVGGDSLKLQSIVEKITDLRKILDNKIIIGSSAGALIFSKYYYENDYDTYHAGLGFLDVGMICHWKDQWNELEELKKYGKGDQEILLIPEGTYIIKEK